MTKTVIGLALEAGFWREHTNTWMCSTEDIELFAELVRADERAKLAEQQTQQEPVAYFNPQVKGGFYWAKPTKITAPVTVSVEPMPLYTTPQAQPKENT